MKFNLLLIKFYILITFMWISYTITFIEKNSKKKKKKKKKILKKKKFILIYNI